MYITMKSIRNVDVYNYEKLTDNKVELGEVPVITGRVVVEQIAQEETTHQGPHEDGVSSLPAELMIRL